MQKMSVQFGFIVGAVVMVSAGCGVTAQDVSEQDMVSDTGTVSAASGSICTSPGKVTMVISRKIGYGQMGKHGFNDWITFGSTTECAYFEDECDAGLYPMNVDTQSNPAYAEAAPGNFSCWWNTPDVICWQHPKINSYVYVRDCYVRPDGSRVDYGCGCY